MNTLDLQRALVRIGFDQITPDGDYGPVTGTAVRNFQTGFAWRDLTIDGLAGPQTLAALEGSLHALDVGQGSASPHFSFSEFRCHGPADADCWRIWIKRDTVRSLEGYRSHVGPLHVVSGCRCPKYNASIRGARDSQHVQGTAADVARQVPWRKVASWRLFAGIGYHGATGLVQHVDRRDLVPAHNNGGTLDQPMTWVYS